MKRIALLLVCGALVASAQEVRISRAALLRSDRSMISLGTGTIVDILSRDEQGLTVRFNRYIGTIPVSSLTPPEKQPMAPAKHSGYQDTDTVSRTKEDAANRGLNPAKKASVILAAN